MHHQITQLVYYILGYADLISSPQALIAPPARRAATYEKKKSVERII